MGGDDEIDRRFGVIARELAREGADGAGVAEEEPSAEGGGVFVEFGDGFGQRVDGVGDGFARVEHAIDAGDAVLVLVDGVDDGIEDELAAASAHEPVVGESDVERLVARRDGWGWCWVVYHLGSTVCRGSRVVWECVHWQRNKRRL